MYVNGRAFVHILVSLVAAFDVYVFRTVNPLIIIGLIVFVTKFSAVDKKAFKISVVACVLLFSLLSINITRQSVYWMDGSFNYLLPIFLSIASLYFVQKSVSLKKFSFITLVLILLASITVEQSSMITFGGLLMIILYDKFILKNKLAKYYFLYLFLSLAGVCSVIFAPGVFARAGAEDKVNITYNIKNLTFSIFLTKDLLVYHMIISLAVIFLLIKIRDKSLFKWSLLIGNICFVCAGIIIGYKNSMTFFAFDNRIKLCAYLGLVAMYCAGLLYYAIYKIYAEKNGRNLQAVILAVGAQLMIVVAPVYGYRTLLCSVVLLFIPAISGIAENYNKKYFKGILLVVLSSYFSMPLIFFVALIIIFIDIFKDRKLRVLNKALASCTILLAIALPMYSNINGYRTNSKYNEYNINAIREFKKQGSIATTISQKKMELYDYGWSYPYISDYHMLVYKMYYNIGEDVMLEFE
jgi:hypothetical protein